MKGFDWERDDASRRLHERILLKRSHGSSLSLYVSAWLRDAYGLLGVPLQTQCVETDINAIKSASALEMPTEWCFWGHMLTFPVKYRDLDISARLCIAVWYSGDEDSDFNVLGGCVMPLFNKHGRLKTDGAQLALSVGAEPDDVHVPSATPHRYSYKDVVAIAKDSDTGDDASNIETLFWLEKRKKWYLRGDVESVSWLDGLTAKALSDTIFEMKASHGFRRALELKIDLPKFMYDVLHCDLDDVVGKMPGMGSDPESPVNTGIDRDAGSSPFKTLIGSRPTRYDFKVADINLETFIDPEIGKDSPAEVMAQKIARSAARGKENPLLRPNTQEKAILDHIIKYPPSKALNRDEKEIIWRFRYALTNEGRAITKFLKCVDWADAEEAAQANKMMQQWATIDVGDALEMLSPVFPIEMVRNHAVEFFRTVSDDELHMFLLQLVQALRYEEQESSELSQFLLERASKNKYIASSLFWYLCSELEDPDFGHRAELLQGLLLSELAANETEHPDNIQEGSIPLQLNLLARLRHLFESIRMYRTADSKTEQVRNMLRLGGSCEDLAHFIGPNPLDPATLLSGVIPEKCLVFKSKVNPVKVVWNLIQNDAEKNTTTAFIYKKGDDLRQDQLVLQILSLMDRLLKKEHLDLQITPYRVLPTSVDDGLIEYVPNAVPLSGILREYGSIQQFLGHHAPSKSAYGIRSQALSNYIRSCAGYIVFTHILGVGDRHNDNVMITTEGRLFHIDFGYFLGRDPKFSTAPIVLNRAIVDGMGGPDSKEYQQFVQIACEALNILRKSASLLLSVIHVMAQSSIPDIRSDPEMAMLKVQEKLWLDLSDEDAAKAFVEMLTAAQSAVLTRIAEVQHRVAQGWR